MTTNNELDRLRKEQSDAVMPMIGPLLDAWEGIDTDLRSEIMDTSLGRYLEKINQVVQFPPEDEEDHQP